jgi:hypothetical protein
MLLDKPEVARGEVPKGQALELPTDPVAGLAKAEGIDDSEEGQVVDWKVIVGLVVVDRDEFEVSAFDGPVYCR